MIVACMVSALILPGASAWSELEQADRAIAETEARLDELEERLQALRLAMAEAEVALGRTELELEETRAQVRQRVRALMQLQSGVRTLVIGRSDSLPEVLRQRKFLALATRYDQRLHESLMEREHTLQNEKAELQRKQRDIQTLEKKLSDQRLELGRHRQERLHWITSAQNDAQRLSSLRSDRAAAERQLTSQLARTQAALGGSSISRAKGKLPWPVTGERSLGFGEREGALPGLDDPLRGWLIKAPIGSDVRPVFAGKVAYRGWIDGFGDVVVIDHGEGVHSLYAHLARVLVEVNEPVSPQVVVGWVGESGRLRGAGLYFEIRQGGRPEDPERWLRR